MKNQTPLELNKRLAELLGWQSLFDAGGTLIGRPPGGAENSRDQAAVPNWAGSWAAAGPLSTEHQIDVLHNWGAVYARWDSGHERCRRAEIIDWDRDTATCHAIVIAVIAKLEARS